MHSHTHRIHACLLPPSIPGSVGDEKAMTVCIRRLGSDLVIFNYEHESWNRFAPGAQFISQFGTTQATAYYRAKGMRKIIAVFATIVRFVLRIPVFCKVFRRSRVFVILGMDIMDGHYGIFSAMHKVFMAYLAAWMNVPRVDIINCSFNDHPSAIVCFALRHLPNRVRIVAREPVSLERMKSRLHRPIDLAADIAFLFEPTAHDRNSLQDHIDWTKREKAAGRSIIGLNLADNHNYDTKALVRMSAMTIERMASCSFVLIPHATYDRDNLPNENRLMHDVLAALSPEAAARCRCIDLPWDHSDMQAVLSSLDFAMCGRMHLLIGILSAGRPACCIAYQGKFNGLLSDYLHAPELLIDVEAAAKEGSFVSQLEERMGDLPRLAAAVATEIPRLRALAEKNFEA